MTSKALNVGRAGRQAGSAKRVGQAKRARIAGAMLALTTGAWLMFALPAPAMAQDSEATAAEIRMREVEAEVRALQRQVFQGGTPTAGAAASNGVGTPASSPMTDMLTRMDAVEAQVARLTAQYEELNNRVRQIEGRSGGGAASAATPAYVAPRPAPVAEAPVAAAPAPVVAPSSARLAAVRAVIKPRTADAAEDEYSYGFKLWQSHFYPEAGQQLQFFLTQYPNHPRATYARNLIGRSYLEDGQPTQAAHWFVDNYKADPHGERAADSLILLAQAMVQLKDTTRACIALGQFADSYRSEASGRLRSDYERTKASVNCN